MPDTGLYVIDFEKMPAAIASLAKELLEQEATGDRARTDAWFKKYGTMPSELGGLLAKTNDIPVDVDPEFDFHPPVPLIICDASGRKLWRALLKSVVTELLEFQGRWRYASAEIR